MTNRKEAADRTKRIQAYYINHDKNKKQTFEHFAEENIPRKTIYRAIKLCEEGVDPDVRKPAGRRPTITTPEMFAKVAEMFKQDPKLSCREAATQLGIPRTAIFRIISKMREQNIETYHKSEAGPRCPTCKQKLHPDAPITKKILERNKKLKAVSNQKQEKQE